MLEITLNDLQKVTGGEILRSSFTGNMVIKGINIDSRATDKGNLFVAILGEKFDGHDFVKDAIKRGAQAAIISRERQPEIDGDIIVDVPVILVRDTKKALGDLAFWYRRKFDVPTVAVTGTNGKTTTKEMIADVLSSKFKLVRSPQSYNNLIGVPLTIFRLNSNSEALVLELGMSEPEEIGILTRMAYPNIGIITNIGPAHLESMHGLEKIAQAKFELPDNMPSPRTLVLNADDPLLAKRIRERKTDERMISFGIHNQANYQADDIQLRPDGCVSFRVNQDLTIDLLLLGKHNVYNALAAFAVGDLLNVSPPKIKEKLERYTPSDLRMQLERIRDIAVINDSYNANPVSMNKALETLQQMQTSGRKIAVLADMLELGEKAVDFHLKIGRRVAELGIDVLLTEGEIARHMAKGAKEAGMNEKNVLAFDDNQQISHYLLENLKPGDLVLVKGSRKMKTEEVVLTLKSLYGRQN